MFLGHHGASFAAGAADRRRSLWFLFVAAMLVDGPWAVLVLLGVEKLSLVPGITASDPLDLYDMPYTHSLGAAVAWSALAFTATRVWLGSAATRSAVIVALVVFSHWALDFVVHRPTGRRSCSRFRERRG